MATISVTDDNIDAEVLKSSKPILVDFWAEWCGPCKMIGPVLEELSDEMSTQVVIAKHNSERIESKISVEVFCIAGINGLFL